MNWTEIINDYKHCKVSGKLTPSESFSQLQTLQCQVS